MSGEKASPIRGEKATAPEPGLAAKSSRPVAGAGASPRASPYEGTLALQRRVGNRAVTGLIRDSGEPLALPLRAFMEPRLGADLGSVRVHRDASAAAAVRGARARALTLGEDILFGAGQYSPRSDTGRVLLAHELTHVVQQRQAGGTAVQGLKQTSDAGDAAEREAERLSARVAAGEPVAVWEAPSALVQRAGLATASSGPELKAPETGATAAPQETVPAAVERVGFAELQRREPEVAGAVERLSAGYRALMERLLPPLEASGVYAGTFAPAYGERATREWIAGQEQRIARDDRYDSGTLSAWVGAVDTNLSHYLPLIVREATRRAEADAFPELARDLAAAEPLRHELSELADRLEETAYLRDARERARAAHAAGAAERRHAERTRETVDALAEIVRRSGHPQVSSILAKMNASAVAHYLMDVRGLRTGEDVVEVFETLRAEDPELLTGVLFLSHTLEVLKQRGMTGLDRYEGLVFDYWDKSAEDILLGDFSEDPTGAAVAVRTLLTLIPGVDQAADIEDLSANVYKLVWQGRVAELGVWFGLTVTLLGAVPGAGSAVKGVLKLGKKGLVFITPAAVRRLAGAVDIGTWGRMLGGKISDLIASRAIWESETVASFRIVLDRLEQILNPMRLVASATAEVDRLLANLRAAREQAGEAIERQMGPILDALQDVFLDLSGEARRVRLNEELDVAPLPGLASRAPSARRLEPPIAARPEPPAARRPMGAAGGGGMPAPAADTPFVPRRAVAEPPPASAADVPASGSRSAAPAPNRPSPPPPPAKETLPKPVSPGLKGGDSRAGAKSDTKKRAGETERTLTNVPDDAETAAGSAKKSSKKPANVPKEKPGASKSTSAKESPKAKGKGATKLKSEGAAAKGGKAAGPTTGGAKGPAQASAKGPKATPAPPGRIETKGPAGTASPGMPSGLEAPVPARALADEPVTMESMSRRGRRASDSADLDRDELKRRLKRIRRETGSPDVRDGANAVDLAISSEVDDDQLRQLVDKLDRALAEEQAARTASRSPPGQEAAEAVPAQTPDRPEGRLESGAQVLGLDEIKAEVRIQGIAVDDYGFPLSWRGAFKSEHHGAFLQELVSFRGDFRVDRPRTASGAKLMSGTEGQLFTSPRFPDRALKRHHRDVDRGSVRRGVDALKRARRAVNGSEELRGFFSIPEIFREGPDLEWIEREFFPYSEEIAGLNLSATRFQEALDALERAVEAGGDKTLGTLRERMRRRSPNVHWDDGTNHFVWIDTQ